MEWVKEKLETFDDELDGLTIDWGTNIYTPVEPFLNKFGDIIEENNNDDNSVVEAITEKNPGYGEYLRNFFSNRI